MQVSSQYWNAHSNPNRILNQGKYNSLGEVHKANPAPAIKKQDEAAYSLKQEINKANRKASKISLGKGFN